MNQPHPNFDRRKIQNAFATEALHCWSLSMNSGIKAYVDGHYEEAQYHFECAFKRVQYRGDRHSHAHVTDLHYLKPCEFLIQLHINENDFNNAFKTLQKLNKELHVNPNLSDAVIDFIGTQSELVKRAENRFFQAQKSHPETHLRAVQG